MASITNKYGIVLGEDSTNSISKKLIADCFKILGIYEGKDPRTKKVVYSEDESYENYQKYLDTFCIEVWGAYELYPNDGNFHKLTRVLEGLKLIKIKEHDRLRSKVFECIDICNKIGGV